MCGIGGSSIVSPPELFLCISMGRFYVRSEVTLKSCPDYFICRSLLHGTILRENFDLIIPTNLSKTKIGTKSLKNRDFWSKIGTFLRIL